MIKIVTIIGARPQFIKAAPLSRYIRTNQSHLIDEVLLHTGQHYDENMSDIFFREMNIPAARYNLSIGSGSHGKQTGEMLAAIEQVLITEKPSIAIVYGDTNSTLAGALAASKLQIPVAHVEAGLRSFNMMMPEEQNRIVADHLSTYLFCPTETAVQNLKNEGIVNTTNKRFLHSTERLVLNTGDIMYDAILLFKDIAAQKSTILDKLSLHPKEYALATVHRAENTDDPSALQSLFHAFSRLSDPVILPLHPRTKKVVNLHSIMSGKNIKIIEPVGYLDMLRLEENAKVILTDSGGMQKEAYFLKIPCVTLRNETEWVETFDHGCNVLAGTNIEKIVSSYEKISRTLHNPNLYNQAIFGDGTAAEKIILALAAQPFKAS
ncbi:MAG: UDP-N-acetylglucosamine 2-epimerase (non-hydrolyzing) [Chitinivibrionales bacterium]|nr:UDP-N-acetylglucosamine 2-epimerase (non-hydrolyzing) [Chitinivibrionales bacterium]